ncbi:MAG: YncE family protein [Terriglobia bacterium]
MKKVYVISLVAIAALIGLAIRGTSPVAAQQPSPRRASPALELYEKIPMPNLIGRIDHFSADGHLLLFSVVGSNVVGIENWFEGRLVRTVPGATEPQGVLYVPGFNKIIQAGSDGKVVILDGATYSLQKTIDFGANADNLRWDAKNKMVLVGFGEENGGIAEIDPATNQRVGQVLKTGGHPESFQIGANGNTIFVNCPDAGNLVEAVNRNTGAVEKWPIHGARGNYAMALNEADHRLYTVTRKPPYLIVFNIDTGQEVARVPGVTGECDDVYFDATRKRIYIIGGVGLISVVQEIDPDHYSLIRNIPSTVGARTGYWYAQHDRLYVGVQAEGNLPAQLFGYEAEN